MKWFLVCFLSISALTCVRAGIISTTARVCDDEVYLNTDEPEDGEVMPGCSWYCGGVDPKVRASSHLKGDTYSPSNAHDFNFKTAWIEGAAGPGIGEYLEYRFKLPSSEAERHNFGINEVVIINGYRKSDHLWEANGRVKTLRMYVNGVASTLFKLKDVKRPQTAPFRFIPLKPGREVVLRFEILEVYPGKKYQDTAISELLFEGAGVH